MKKQILTFISLLALAFSAKAQWLTQATGFTAVSRGIGNISVPSANVAWASAYDGSGSNAAVQEFTRTLDGGTTWTPGMVTGFTGYNASDIFALNKDIAWFLLYSSTGNVEILKTIDGGTSWIDQGGGGFLDYVHFWDANTGVVVGDPNGGNFEIYTTTDGGTTWNLVPSANINAVPATGEFVRFGNASCVAGDNVWCAVGGGTAARVLKSADKGMHWTIVPTGLTNIRQITFKDANNGLILESTGKLQRSTDGGATWTTVTTTGPVFGLSINYIPSTIQSLVTTSYFYSSGPPVSNTSGSSYSLDNGVTWIKVDSTIQHGYNEFFSATVGYAGGFNSSPTVAGIFKWNSNVLGVAQQLESSGSPFVYPNPSKGVFFVGAKTSAHDVITINVYNIIGKLVYSSTEKSNSSDYRKGIDLEKVPKGFYMVEVKSGGSNILTQKVIIE